MRRRFCGRRGEPEEEAEEEEEEEEAEEEAEEEGGREKYADRRRWPGIHTNQSLRLYPGPHTVQYDIRARGFRMEYSLDALTLFWDFLPI